jgi:transcriptional regulator with XRE-family HTH domain
MGKMGKRPAHRLLRGIGKAIRHERLSKGLSQEALADLTELHRTYVGSVERGERNVSVVNLAKLAAALDISLSNLLREAEAIAKDGAKP